jgi:hypothetical protein
LVLMMVVGVVALLCLGGTGVAFVAYREATEPDRSAPDVVVDNYLRAMFVERNEAAVGDYTCSGQPDLAAARVLRDEIERREVDFDVEVRVSWGRLSRSRLDDRREVVETELTIASSAQGASRGRRTENWRFDVVDEDGWRVCGAAKA